MADFYKTLWPLIRLVSPEFAHRLSIRALKWGMVPAPDPVLNRALETDVFGWHFSNPVGLAAGFDKSAEVHDALFRFGFGFIEVGSVTPRPQAGNPKPRLFRLEADRAVINRMGFNNDGADAVAGRLLGRERDLGVVGVNLGKNKDTVDGVSDFVVGAKTFAPLADYLVVNVSSPNTPGLRALQSPEALSQILRGVRRVLSEQEAGPSLLLKIAPDLTEQDEDDIAAVVLTEKIDGLIVSNTTLERPEMLESPAKAETGGLSGRPLFRPSTDLLSRMYRKTGGQVPIIGVGGIETGKQAYEKIRAGASLVQIYSALVYEGPGLVARINRELLTCLRGEGFTSVADAVGADHRK